MTDLLAEVMTDLRAEFATLAVDQQQVGALVERVEQKHRWQSGGDKHYIRKVSDCDARRRAIAAQVAAGGDVAGVAQAFGVSTWTVYDAVRAHPEQFGRRGAWGGGK